MNPEIDPRSYTVGYRYRVEFACADGHFSGAFEDVLIGIETFSGLSGSPGQWRSMVGALQFRHGVIGPPSGVTITCVGGLEDGS